MVFCSMMNVPYLSSPVIGVDASGPKVRLVESIKKTLVLCQGCVASGKSTMWNNAKNTWAVFL